MIPADTLLYEERLSSRRTEAVFIALTILFLLVFVSRLASGLAAPLSAAVFFLFGVSLFYAVNYRTLQIHLTSGSLTLTFGVFAWTVPLSSVDECRLDDVPLLLRMGGAGIHFMIVGRRYRISFNFLEYPRVVVMLKERRGLVRDISFSTRRPHDVLRLIR